MSWKNLHTLLCSLQLQISCHNKDANTKIIKMNLNYKMYDQH